MSPKVLFLGWFALVAGFLGGAWVGGAPLTAEDAARSADAAVADGGRGGAPGCPEPTDPHVRELTVAIGLATERLRGIRAALRDIVGDPVPFPDDLPEAYRPEGVRALAAEALSDPKFQVLGVHCEEYPCLIEVAGPASPAEGAKSRLAAAAHPFLLQHVTMDDERSHAVIALLPPGRTPPSVVERVAHRAKPLLSLDLARPAQGAP
jgi:hypothetical protein